MPSGTGTFQNVLQFIQSCKNIPPTQQPIRVNGNGLYWFAGYPWHIAVGGYTHVSGPNSVTCMSQNGATGDATWLTFGDHGGATPPTSNHPGGVNVGFADGSVKFIKDTVALQTWWALGTRNHGEAISSSSY